MVRFTRTVKSIDTFRIFFSFFTRARVIRGVVL